MDENVTGDKGVCDFHQGSCEMYLGDTLVRLSVSPAEAPSEKPITFSLETDKPLRLTDSRLEGRDMFMGVIPLMWQPAGKNTYRATTVYGACSSGFMVWRLWLGAVDEAGQKHTTWFDFLADAQ